MNNERPSPSRPNASGDWHTTRVALALAAVLGLAACVRSYRLLSLFPILVDESIYLRWAEIIEHQGQWFISLLDAKQPLSYWIYALIRMAQPELDPLLGPRIISVLAGVTSSAALYAIGRRLSGPPAGLLASLFYALLPYGVFYDRLAYTDAMVNCFGLLVTLGSLVCFQASRPRLGPALGTGMALGAGFFTKASVALFALVPIVAAVLWSRQRFGQAARPLLVIYAVALVFPCLSFVALPAAPVFEVNSLFIHHTSFFTPLRVLSEHPFVNVSQNVMALGTYLGRYVTSPLGVAAAVSLLYLIWLRRPETWLVVPLIAVPWTVQIMFLEYFPSRYVFPHVWPLALFTALAIVSACRAYRLSSVTATVVVAITVVPLIAASGQLLLHPESRLEANDAWQFLSSGPFSGYGVRQAIAYLERASSDGPITILTDPIWGTPADAIHAYLNGRRGIRVYDAWWLQLPGEQPILPTRPMEVLKSQYERVSVGTVDFQASPSVYYVTDTNYVWPEDVGRRQPHATLLARFPKPNGIDSIDVYRLK